MTAIQEPPAHATGVPGDGFPSGDLTLLRFHVEQALSADTCALSESELIDQIQEVESLQASLSALQSARIRGFAQAHVDSHRVDDRTDFDKIHRSVVAQIQLACRVSTTEARTRMANARDLHSGLDRIRGLHIAGELSAAKVSAIAVECRDLNTAQRARVDSRLAAVRDLTRYGIGRLRAMTRRLVAEVAPDRFRARVHAGKAERGSPCARRRMR
ncbi:DUF222 domain-containing protein [Pseudonocardia alni]|uniref:DUF222 domain-containing protein n=1 Tax=Pseudonocardia alni TaxID=33907 RepID=UPI001FCA604C|nr:DUF222 domain-containing protein [Pseudonocardia alni]